MSFRIPSLSEARDFLIAVGKAVFPDRNYGNLRSYHSRRATFFAAAQTQLHAHIKSVGEDVHPLTASDGDPINRWGQVLGVDRKTATGARKSSAGLVIGTAATPVDAGEELIHQASGLRFEVGTSTTVGVDETALVDIVAISTGSETRLAAGQVLEFVNTPAGLQTSVRLVTDLDEDGYDDEQFGAYRSRVLAALSEPTAGGTQSDYVAWMLEVQGVAQAFCYPNRAGLGTIDIVALHAGSGTARELDAGDQATVLAYVAERAPAQVSATNGSLRHLDVVPEEVDVEIVLDTSGEAAYVFDWAGGPVEVLAWTAGTRTLQFAADRPATMKAGHRISLKGVASAQDGEELTIEALSGSDAVILETAPSVAPAATDLGYSGGPLVTPVRDAIKAHMSGEKVYAGKRRIPLAESATTSTVGLEVLVDGIGTANPDGAYGPWNGNLLRSLLYQIAMYKAGVRNATIAAPTTDIEPTEYTGFDDDQIGLIVPGAILVRGAL